MLGTIRKIPLVKGAIKRFGILLTTKMILHYCYFPLKLRLMDLSKEQMVIANECKLSIIPNDKGISRELAVFGKHEPLHTELLSKELKEGMVCLDVGSNIGYYAILESRLVGIKGKVIALEPSPENFRYLKKNMKLQKFSNMEIHNVACGDQNGITQFSVSDKSNWSRVADENVSVGVQDQVTQIIEVQIKKIDSILKGKFLERVDLIRMDVEGYEYNVYKGMSETISKFKPIIIIEFHKYLLGKEKSKEFLYELKDKGYEIKYYIREELDFPMVGRLKDVQRITIDDLITKLEKNLLSNVFTIFLENKGGVIIKNG